MAGKPREPIDLIVAKGKKHLTKDEIEERKAQEVDVPFVDVKPPSYLKGKKQKGEFKKYADMLLKIGIFTELDVDCLARYIIAQNLYLSYTEELSELIGSGNIMTMKEIQGMQDKVFKQAQTSARDLGLTITSRCKLVSPTPPDDDDEL